MEISAVAIASIGVVLIVTIFHPVEYIATASVPAIFVNSSENSPANIALFISSKLAGNPTFIMS